MPAKSKAQQKAAGAALSAQRGQAAQQDLLGASKDMFDTMSEAELEDLASPPHEDMPDRVEDEKW